MHRVVLFLFLCAQVFGASKTVCLSMVTYNDAPTLRSCLESIKPFIDTWAIVDLGSIDQTQKLIAEVLGDIPGELQSSPFHDFETHRNVAFSLAQSRADYVLVLNPNETLHGFVKPALDQDAYFVRVKDRSFDYYRQCLVNANRVWHWEGVLHQGLTSTDAKTVAILPGIVSAMQQSPEKEVLIWQSAFTQKPMNLTYAFHLALSHQAAGHVHQALECFQTVTRLQERSEEVFWSWYQMGKLQELLQLDPRESYSKAYELRPSRAEPLYHLAQYFLRTGNLEQAYATARQALGIPVPEDRVVEHWVYQYGLKVLCADAAFLTGRHLEAQAICEKLLSEEKLPPQERERVQQNFYALVTR